MNWIPARITNSANLECFYTICNKQNVAALARFVKNTALLECSDIMDIMKASFAKKFVIGALVVVKSKQTNNINLLMYCTISNINDMIGFSFAAVHKICCFGANVNQLLCGSCVEIALKCFETQVVPTQVATRDVGYYVIFLDADQQNDKHIYDFLISKDYAIYTRMDPDVLCEFIRDVDDRPICSAGFVQLTNPASQLEQQHVTFYRTNEIHRLATPDILDHLRWKYTPINDQITIGYLEMQDYTDFECFLVDLFIQKFASGCSRPIDDTFRDFCSKINNSMLYVLLIKPKTIAPEESIENYSFNGRYSSIDVKSILKSVDAPIAKGLVGISFALCQVIRIKGTNLGYQYTLELSRCPVMADKYERDIPVDPSNGRRYNVTVMLLDFAEQHARQYGKNVMRLDEVPFAVLTSVPTAYFFYLNKAGYTQIENPTEMLNCELFGLDTAQTPQLRVAVNERNEKIMVPQICDGMFVMYKPLTSQ